MSRIKIHRNNKPSLIEQAYQKGKEDQREFDLKQLNRINEELIEAKSALWDLDVRQTNFVLKEDTGDAITYSYSIGARSYNKISTE